MMRELKMFLMLSVMAVLLPTVVMAEEWEIVMPGPRNARQVFFTDTLHGVIAGNPEKIYTFGRPEGSPIVWTDDSGETWHNSEVDIDLKGYQFYALWFSNEKIGWAGGMLPGCKETRLLKTEDGGKTWKSKLLPEDAENIWLDSIWFDCDGKKGWLNPLIGPILWNTEDGGKTWEEVDISEADSPIDNPTHPGFYAFSFEHVILCGALGVILETKDAGYTWEARQVPFEGKDYRIGLKAIHFAPDGKNGWAVGREGEAITGHGSTQFKKQVILHTKDGGLTWERQKVDIITPLRDVWAVSKDEAWICGIGGDALPTWVPGCLLHTTDGGKTWKDVNPSKISLRKLFFIDSQHGWVSGGSGGSVHGEPASAVLIYVNDQFL